MKFFDKTHKNMSLRAKLAYIQNHERKDKGTEIIFSNNIKIYNLPLTEKQLDKAWEIITDDHLSQQLWDLIGSDLDNFSDEENIHIFVGGTSGGYLVLPYERHLDDWELLTENHTYKDEVKYKKSYGYSYTEAQYLARVAIEETFDLLQTFDHLCDCLLEYFKEILDEAEIEEVEVEKVQKVTYKELTWA